MTDESRQLLSVEETAQILGISKQTIYNKTQKNADIRFPIPHVKCGRLIKFDRRDVFGFIERNKTN